MKRISAITLAIILILGCAVLAREITVGPNEAKYDFTSIQKAIDTASPGDTIIIAPGIYRENLLIALIQGDEGDPLILQGMEEVIIKAADRGAPVIKVKSGIVTFNDLTIKQGITGILVLNKSEVLINRSTIKENIWEGITLRQNAHATIIATTIINSREGLLFTDASVGLIRESTIREQREVGILLSGTSRLTIIDSIIKESLVDGIVAEATTVLAITGSQIINHPEAGLLVRGNALAEVSDSTIAGNEMLGVGAEGNAQISLVDTLFTENHVGIVAVEAAMIEINRSKIIGSEIAIITIDAQVKADQVTIKENSSGVLARGAARLTLANSTLHKNLGVAITALENTYLTISNTKISATPDVTGISLAGSTKTQIIGSTIIESMTGIELVEKTQVTITGSVIAHSFFGITVADAGQLTINDGTIEEEERIKNRARERAEYEYDRDRARRLEKDEDAEQRAALEKELRLLREEAERDISTREAAICAREEEIERMGSEVEEFPARLEAAILQAQERTAAEVRKEMEQQAALVAVERNWERKSQEQTIRHLQDTNKSLEKKIQDLSTELREAHQQINVIAAKAVEGTSISKAFASMNQITREQTAVQKTSCLE